MVWVEREGSSWSVVESHWWGRVTTIGLVTMDLWSDVDFEIRSILTNGVFSRE